MTKLKNSQLAGRALVTSYGVLRFDATGLVTEPELTEEAIAELTELKHFEVISEAKKEEKKEESKEEEKAPEKEAEKVEEEEKPKRSSRKSSKATE